MGLRDLAKRVVRRVMEGDEAPPPPRSESPPPSPAPPPAPSGEADKPWYLENPETEGWEETNPEGGPARE